MMCRKLTEISDEEAKKTISAVLEHVMPGYAPSAFLRIMNESSGLLVERDRHSYGFTHSLFQAYLASLHVLKENLVAELCSHVAQPWWHPTIRLYCAQADAGPILEKCVGFYKPDIGNSDTGHRLRIGSPALRAEPA
jgi:predicted NACHT family NTPase